MIIDKETFSKWEESVIKTFYTNKRSKTDLIPKNNKPSILKQSKTIIVLDFDHLSENVKTGTKKKLPQKHKISLFHIGKMKNDTISIGYSDNIFFHPALDFGGLSNYKQNLGEKDKLKPRKFNLKTKTEVESNLDEIYNTWKKYNNKNRLYANMKEKLRKFLHSAVSFLNKSDYSSINIRYFKLPDSHRVITTSDDIKKLTGNYYKRIYKSDDQYAKQISGKDLYCTINNFFVNTINRGNLLNEYSTY